MQMKGAFVLEIGIWNLDIVCYLEFGIWNLSPINALSSTLHRLPFLLPSHP
jgi:hypothetical protein